MLRQGEEDGIGFSHLVDAFDAVFKILFHGFHYPVKLRGAFLGNCGYLTVEESVSTGKHHLADIGIEGHLGKDMVYLSLNGQGKGRCVVVGPPSRLPFCSLVIPSLGGDREGVLQATYDGCRLGREMEVVDTVTVSFIVTGIPVNDTMSRIPVRVVGKDVQGFRMRLRFGPGPRTAHAFYDNRLDCRDGGLFCGTIQGINPFQETGTVFIAQDTALLKLVKFFHDLLHGARTVLYILFKNKGMNQTHRGQEVNFQVKGFFV